MASGWGGLNQIIDNALQNRERERPWNPPPLPDTMPAITPVADMKNRVAMQHQYTPEAAQELYDTPTWVRFGDGSTDTQPSSWRDGYRGSDGVAGFYGGQAKRYEDGSMAPNDYEIAINSQDANRRADGTLAHEFAHKWYDRRLAPEDKLMWSESNSLDANQYAQDRANARLQGDRPIDYYNELYAHNAERGPSYINPEVRQESYPGLYQENIRPANPPVPEWMRYRLQSDEAHGIPARRPAGDSYGMDYWVNEEFAPLGYYEDGGAIPSIPTPAQWSTPKWPTMEMYNNFNWIGGR